MLVNGHGVPGIAFAYTGVVVSFCLSVGVMYAHKLFKYIGRLNRQRQLFNKRILTAVLRRGEVAVALLEGAARRPGTAALVGKMSLSALAREQHDDAQRELIDNTTYVIDEAIRSLREISNNLSPHVLNDFGLARGVQALRVAQCGDAPRRRSASPPTWEPSATTPDVEVILYRVICELISNSLKHSGCASINLSLSRERRHAGARLLR